MESPLIFIEDCTLTCTNKPTETNSCFRGGILENVHKYSFDTFTSALPQKLQNVRDPTTILNAMKASNKITVRQYLFAAGLAFSYKQMANTSRTLSSDDPAKTMFLHLIDLIKPTCTDIRIDLCGPGPISQQTKKERFILTGKLELAYSTYRTAYNYSLVLVIEMKSLSGQVMDDSKSQPELQLLAEMSYCMKTSPREYVLGILFNKDNVSSYILYASPSWKYFWAKLQMKGSITNNIFSVGHEIEQLIFHSLHSTLEVTFESNKFELKTNWKTCCIMEPLYIKDRLITTDDNF